MRVSIIISSSYLSLRTGDVMDNLNVRAFVLYANEQI